MKTLFIVATISAFLVGCATSQEERMAWMQTNERIAVQYYDAQKQANSNAQKPLVRIEAMEGKQIVLGGVKVFEVYAPQGNNVAVGNSGPALLAMPKVEMHPAAQAAVSVLATTAPVVGSIFAMGYSMKGIANAVGNSNASIASDGFGALSNMGSSNVGAWSALAARPSTVVSGNGNMIGDGNTWDASTITNNLNGTGTMGGGTFNPSAVVPPVVITNP